MFTSVCPSVYPVYLATFFQTTCVCKKSEENVINKNGKSNKHIKGNTQWNLLFHLQKPSIDYEKKEK